MAKRCVSTINALPSKLRYGAVRARAIRYGAFVVEAELPCINGLRAWFTIAHIDAIDDSELLMTEGAIGNAKDIAEAIVAALATPSPAGGVREAVAASIANMAPDIFAKWKAEAEVYPNCYQSEVDRIYLYTDRAIAALSSPASSSDEAEALPAGVEAARIAAFLKERDESVLPEETDDAERNASAEEIFRLATSAVVAGLPRDVIRLVIAAREVAYSDPTPETIRELDKASEAFADRVPWEDEPLDDEETVAAPSDAGETGNG